MVTSSVLSFVARDAVAATPAPWISAFECLMGSSNGRALYIPEHSFLLCLTYSHIFALSSKCSMCMTLYVERTLVFGMSFVGRREQ